MEGRRVRPVHFIVKHELFVTFARNYGLIIDTYEKDYTQSGTVHYHIAAQWPIRTSIRGHPTLTPARTTLYRRYRRYFGCTTCKNWSGKKRCHSCGLYIKVKWPKTPTDYQYILNYIRAKQLNSEGYNAVLRRCQH